MFISPDANFRLFGHFTPQKSATVPSEKIAPQTCSCWLPWLAHFGLLLRAAELAFKQWQTSSGGCLQTIGKDERNTARAVGGADLAGGRITGGSRVDCAACRLETW